MSGLEVFGAVAAAIQLSTSFLGHLNTIRNAPKERRRLFEEVVSLMSILNAVRDALDQDEKQNAAIETQLKTPLANFSQRLELMEEKLLRKSRLRDLGWPIERSEVEASLQAIERVKTTCAFVLGYSNRCSSLEPLYTPKADWSQTIDKRGQRENTWRGRKNQPDGCGCSGQVSSA